MKSIIGCMFWCWVQSSQSDSMNVLGATMEDVLMNGCSVSLSASYSGVCVCVCAFVRACVRACVRVCVCVRWRQHMLLIPDLRQALDGWT